MLRLVVWVRLGEFFFIVSGLNDVGISLLVRAELILRPLARQKAIWSIAPLCLHTPVPMQPMHAHKSILI